MDKAGFFSRFVAWFIDGIAVGILAWIVAFIVAAVFGLTVSTESTLLGLIGGALMIITLVILFFFQFFYFGYFWSKSGQSIGMKLLNVKVVRRSDEPLSFLRSGFRGTVGYWISGLVFGLGYIWAAFDSNKETWHDKIFDTWVVTS
jgi:uncharacterized RDD family membrane protein YckC